MWFIAGASTIQDKRLGGCCEFASIGSERQDTLYIVFLVPAAFDVSKILVCVDRHARTKTHAVLATLGGSIFRVGGGLYKRAL